jgi:hypothetical protein
MFWKEFISKIFISSSAKIKQNIVYIVIVLLNYDTQIEI